MIARAAQENDSSRAKAEQGFFATGYRPLTPPAVRQSLTLRDVYTACATQTSGAPADVVEVTLGQKSGTISREAACSFVSERQDQLRVRFAGEADETLLTLVPSWTSFAVNASGTITRYRLVPQVTEERRGFAEGVGCCCDYPQPPIGDATLAVIVGPFPATKEVLVPYGIVSVTFCDPSAPQ